MTPSGNPARVSSTADAGETAKFERLAAEWWDPTGPMAPLHAMNPARMAWIAERLPLRPGLRVLDVGCGAGLASEWLARRGAEVTGLDAAGTALDVARARAGASGLPITYLDGGPEALEGDALFDGVLALEVIEHVPPAARPRFAAALARLVRPGGCVFLSTLNRTARSYAFAILGAERVLRWLPRGTHDWKLFVTPSELAALLRGAGLVPSEASGLVPAPLAGGFRASRDLGVNYILAARRPA